MTKELFRKAFEAGEDRGRFVMMEGYSNAFHSDYTDFETWYEQNYGNTDIMQAEGSDSVSEAAVASEGKDTVAAHMECKHKITVWDDFGYSGKCLECGEPVR
ncbi:MAG: hypothetical protein VKL39_23975, partial [Leptolyngbyaceae bacterium]|nr:hypothetical protein [Leptolyngbyaceae bacterium]